MVHPDQSRTWMMRWTVLYAAGHRYKLHLNWDAKDQYRPNGLKASLAESGTDYQHKPKGKHRVLTDAPMDNSDSLMRKYFIS
jgi:hypothetical protein